MNRWMAGADAQPVDSKMIERNQLARFFWSGVLLARLPKCSKSSDQFGRPHQARPRRRGRPAVGVDCLAKANHGPLPG